MSLSLGDINSQQGLELLADNTLFKRCNMINCILFYYPTNAC